MVILSVWLRSLEVLTTLKCRPIAATLATHLATGRLGRVVLLDVVARALVGRLRHRTLTLWLPVLCRQLNVTVVMVRVVVTRVT